MLGAESADALQPAAQLALVAAGGFFLTGLLTGVWKYRWTMASEEAEAPYYVNTAHRASLLYSFASILLYHFAIYSAWSAVVDLAAVAVLVFFFAAAVASYVVHGVLQDTDNQFRAPYVLGPLELPEVLVRAAMWLLILGEIGGFIVLFTGFLIRFI